MKARAFCLLSTVFMAALALMSALFRTALFLPLDNDILSFLLVRVSIGTFGCPRLGNMLKLLSV